MIQLKLPPTPTLQEMLGVTGVFKIPMFWCQPLNKMSHTQKRYPKLRSATIIPPQNYHAQLPSSSQTTKLSYHQLLQSYHQASHKATKLILTTKLSYHQLPCWNHYAWHCLGIPYSKCISYMPWYVTKCICVLTLVLCVQNICETSTLPDCTACHVLPCPALPYIKLCVA